MEKFTAVFERGEQGWWVATCPEIPGAVSQGRTIDEAREMLRDAIVEVRIGQNLSLSGRCDSTR